MAVTHGTYYWGGLGRDELYLFTGAPPLHWGQDFVYTDDDDRGTVAVLRGMTDDESTWTDEIAGLSIDGFTTFDAWDSIPNVVDGWCVDDLGPADTVTILRQLQQRVLRDTRPLARAS